MTKKGKFQLLSYLVDGYLIYYKSLSKNKKIVAFAMFESIIFNPILHTLNQFLKKRQIHYYTIQLSTLEKNRKIFLLNFEEMKKESIIKIFNEIYQNLVEINESLIFFKNSKLERKFLEPILKDMNSKVSIMKQNGSLLVLNSADSFLLDFYQIEFDYLEQRDSFIHSFISVINSFNKEGYLIFNFKIDNNNDIIFNSYFTEIIIESDKSVNTEEDVNTFFNYDILKRQDIKIRDIFNYIWRLGITENFFSLKFFKTLFFTKNQDELTKLLRFNKKFEDSLLKNQIEFIRLNKNLLLIEEKFLLLALPKLKSETIQKIIKKYLTKYFIYITILSKKHFRKLLNTTEFKSLHNLHLLYPEEIIEFNVNIFRNKN